MTWRYNTVFSTDVSILHHFYAPQLYRQVLLRARITYGNSVRPSICLSVTTRYGFKARWDRDSGSSPYDSLESLVSYEVIWCHWVRRFPSKERIKRGSPLEITILPLLAHLAWKRLQIDTDLLCIITSTADELSGVPTSMTLNPQNMGLRRTLTVHFRWNILEIDQDNLRTKLNWCCCTSHEH